MADMISPGVYTKIIDLNSYLTSQSGTVGFVPVITEKGPDNVLTRITSYEEYVTKFGEPDIRTFGKYYGCGPYIAAQHLSVSSDLYVIRALPDDATYAHTFIYFSSVDDFPYAYKFAQRYADQICDAGATKVIPLYKIANGKQFNRNKVAQAIAANAAYDGGDEGNLPQRTDIAAEVEYTSDVEFAEFDSYEPLYAVSGDLTTEQIAKAIEAGVAYGEDFTKVEDTSATSLILYVSVKTLDGIELADGGESAAESAYVEGSVTYKPVTSTQETHETTSSEGDDNVGYNKYMNVGGWYTGKHTSLSAFSVVPGMIYANQSDVTCYQQSHAKNAAYVIKDDEAKETAFAKRCGFDAQGYVVLDDMNRIVFTSRAALAKVDSDGKLVEGEGVRLEVPVYDVDDVPWYEISDNVATKKTAVADYDAYDANGFITRNYEEAVYCGKLTYAKAGANGKPVEQKTVPLRAPQTSKFVVDSESYLYTFDRKVKKDLSQAQINKNAMDAIVKFAAWDENGYPATKIEDVYVTSIEDYAVKSVAPKMSSTQKMDSIFYGYDTLITAAIKNIDGDAIYSTDKRLPHNCVLGSVRAVGRGDYYNDYAIKITSDANPKNFGVYKFQIFEHQDGEEVLAESFNVSFDPSALDGDGESQYFVDVINKFSTRVIVEANENAVDLFSKCIKDFYQNDPTIADIADTETFTASAEIDGKTVKTEVPLVGNFPAVVPTFDEESGKVINADFDVVVDEVKAILIAAAKESGIKEDMVAAENYAVGTKGKLLWEAYYAKAWAEKYTFDSAKAYNAALELDDSDENKSAQLLSAIEMMNVAEDMSSDASEIYSWATAKNLMNMNDSDSITAGEQPYYLENGSLGSLVDNKGNVKSTIGDQILCWAYTGILKNPVTVKKVDENGNIIYKTKYTDEVYDTDWYYFSLVYDPGYKPDVKEAALELCDTYRRDCVLISDCTDNADYEDCLKYVGYVQGAADCRAWNTYLAARYEPYTRIYDKYTGKDIWISPVYHMSQLLAKNDSLYGIQYASAGFNRGTVSAIKELRYSPNKAQRDLLYMAQVNPIVHFPEGMTVWGQLTTQKKNSPLSDLNTVRVVLYIKRALEQWCRGFIFELNEQDTWDQIMGEVSGFLSNCASQNLIEDFTCIVGATEYELKTKTCHVNVTLVTKKTLEKIELNLFVK